MAMDSRFLELPRELRNIIYVYYVLGDGYIYDSQTRTLKTAKGSPIDLALMFTCRQVACEMKGVALRNNTITFRTVPTEEPLRSPFGYTDLLQFVYKLKRSLFRYARPCFTEDLRSKVAQVHPEFMPAFDLTDLEYNWGADGAGFLPSVIHSAMDYTLELASSHSQFSRAMARFDHNYGMYWQGMKPDHEALRNLRYEPWKIPTEDEIRWMAKACGFRHDASQRRMLTRPRRPVKCYFSAAAACIQFLGSVPASTRSEIRHIVLDEDHPAIAKQAGHARGLIPFCKENPRLRVERRANLWRSIFMYDLYDSSKEVSFADVDYLDTFDVLEHISATMTGSVSKWTMEALALIPAGMPPNSFCLVFDGDAHPLPSSDVFQRIIKRNAIWQAAMEECVKRGFLHHFDFLRNEEFRYNCYFYKQFPKALDDIINRGASVVRCNFDLGTFSLSDVESLVEQRRGWTLQRWHDDWTEHEFLIDLFNRDKTPEWIALLNDVRTWIGR